MVSESRNNFISIAKAIGIILMVTGHSGCPILLSRFLYLFHMPLFFVCSGYFFKEITNYLSLKTFYNKKFLGLYLTYFKWSFGFLLLHNIFVGLKLIPCHLYDFKDLIIQFLKMTFMTDFELLIRPFWFVKELFVALLLVALLSVLKNRYANRVSNIVLTFFMLFLTFLCKYASIIVPLIGDVSILTFSITYVYLGIIFREHESSISFSSRITLLSLIITLFGSLFFIGEIDMRYTKISNLIPYFFFSITGIHMIFSISKFICRLSHPLNILYYIGNNTMPILALNLLALKIANLIKIVIYNMPINALASHTIIFEHNEYFWVLNILLGVAIPLICNTIFNKVKFLIKNIEYYW